MREKWTDRQLVVALTVLIGLVTLVPVAHADSGRISWFDLVTEDAAVAREFYGGLFDWQFEGESKDGSSITATARSEASWPSVDRSLNSPRTSGWLRSRSTTSMRAPRKR
jgi:hypothetical protein